MTLNEAKDRFLNKICDISWEPIDRPMRKGEAIMRDTLNVLVTEIFVDTHDKVCFRCKDKIYVPFEVTRLRNPRNP